MKKILIIMLAAACASLLFVGCERTFGLGETEQTQVVFAPGVYGMFAPAAGTKAVNLANTGNTSSPDYYYNGFLGEPAMTQLPIDATVWLTYRKGTPRSGATNMQDPASFTWETPNLQAYIVRDASGYNALYPCKTKEVVSGGVTYVELDLGSDGKPVYSTPLYLEDGYYQFRAVSPANRIRKSDLAMQVNNGMQVYANDERYEQTRSKIVQVRANGTGVQNIVLNPMINEMARIKVTIHPGENVATMEMMSQGVEISGLQNPEMEGTSLAFNWSSMNLADTLKIQRGSKYSRASIRTFTKDASDAFVGELCILPTDASSTVTVLLVNMAVNGVPTQYLLLLNQLKYFHGHSYNLDLEIGLEGQIRVMNWANQSWTGEVTLN